MTDRHQVRRGNTTSADDSLTKSAPSAGRTVPPSVSPLRQVQVHLVISVRLALRRLRAGKQETAMFVVLLGLASAANTAVFSVVDGVLFRPLPFPQHEELVALRTLRHVGGAPVEGPLAPDALAELAGLSNIVASLAAIGDGQLLDEPADGEGKIQARLVSASLFSTLGVAPAVGRPFGAGAADTNPAEAVISWAFWSVRFGGDPDILGQTVQIGGRRLTVVGVMPPGYDFPWGADVWIPLRDDPALRFREHLFAVARLRPDISIAHASAAFSAALAGWSHAQGVRAAEVIVRPLRQAIRPLEGPSIAILLMASSFVLVVTWVHLASLFVGRTLSSTRGVAIVMALGATPAHVAVQAIVEGLLLALMALGAALVAGPWLTAALLSVLPDAVKAGATIALDARSLSFSFVLAVAGFCCFASVPGLEARRLDLAVLISKGVSLWGLAPRRTARELLLAAQIAAAVSLLYLAGGSVLAVHRFLITDLGIDPRGLLAIALPVEDERHREVAATADLVEAVIADVKDADAVIAAAAAGAPPVDRGGFVTSVRGTNELVEDVRVNWVTPGFFDTARIRLLEGRDFSRDDGPGASCVTTINRTLARRLGGASPPGATLLVLNRPCEIVGIVEDVRDRGPDFAARPQAFLAARQTVPAGLIFVRVASDDAATLAEVRDRVRRSWRGDAGRRLDVGRVESTVGVLLAVRRALTTVVVGLGSLALLLTAVALVSGVQTVVLARRHEIAVRLAVGAAPLDVGLLIFRRIATAVVTGGVAGLLVGVGLARAARSVFAGLEPLEPAVAAGIAFALVSAGLGAALVAGWRSARVLPQSAFRQE